MRSRTAAFAGNAAHGNFMNYMGTNTSSRKVAQLRKDPRSCLYYVNSTSFEGLTVTGLLEEVLDREVKAALWMPSWEQYYSGGIDGGDYSIFRFVPEHARYYHGLEVAEFECAL
jgi:general stress protein 26